MANANSTNTPILVLDGQLMIGATGLPPAAAVITPGTGIEIINGPNSIDILSTGEDVVRDANSNAIQMDVNTVYQINNGASLCTLTLPAAADAGIGDFVEVSGYSAGGWAIAQNANQQILFNGDATTVGVGGSLSSDLDNNCVKLRCCTADGLIWNVVSSVGNINWV